MLNLDPLTRSAPLRISEGIHHMHPTFPTTSSYVLIQAVISLIFLAQEKGLVCQFAATPSPMTYIYPDCPP